jgi:hypothetical protein
VHLITPGAAPELIRLAPFQFPCAGAAQDKPQALVLHKPLDLIEELWHLLYFVDNDRLLELFRVCCKELLSQQRGTFDEFKKRAVWSKS